MKKLFLLMALFSIGIVMYSQAENGKRIPVTTGSKTGLSLYNKAMKYYDDVNLKEAIDGFKQALAQDPDFFMANYQLAFYFLLNSEGEGFSDYAEAAINCKARLSDGEELLKSALMKLKEGQNNFVDQGKKLIEMYPADPYSYNNMIYFQTLAGDSTGIIETLNQAIKISPHPASFYNQLGYAYLTLKEIGKAETAFNKYIELDPRNPNAYDSKGDFYMYTKDYYKAYQSYTTANSMDPAFSHEKADIAKRLYERTEGKRLKIITI
jgi:tetratricopeptide (TPR) repeat protein